MEVFSGNPANYELFGESVIRAGSLYYKTITSVCDSSKFWSGASCSTCHTSCSSCSGLTAAECTSCFFSDVKHLDTPNIGTCVALTCPVGTYVYNQTCHSCPPQCAGCTLKECTSCAPGVKKIKGICCDVENGQYVDFDQADIICKNCDLSCKTCDGGASNQCLSCKSPLVLDTVNGRCVEKCHTGTFLNQNLNICEKCPIGCLSCTDSKNCDSCFFP